MIDLFKDLRWRLGLVPRVMISGVLRSGTTLVQRIVVSGINRSEASPEFEWPREILAGVPHDLAATAIDRAFYAMWKDLGRPRAAIGKDPLLMPFLEDFVSIYSAGRVVVSIRDPRDVVSSILDVRARMISQGTSSFIATQNEEQTVSMVAEHSAAALRLKHHPRVHLVRYEDLARRDQTALRSLGAFLDADLSYEIHGMERESGPFATPLFGAPPSDESIGRYTKVLSGELISAINAKNQQVIEAFGY